MEENYQEEILALIARKLAGLADDLEVMKLKLWISESDTNKDFFEQIKNIWEASDRNIDTKMINTPVALAEVLNRIRRKSYKKNIWLYWQRIAAILLIPLLISSLLLLYFGLHNFSSTVDIAYNEVFAAFGTRSSLRLSDSTLVWLNSGSSIQYPVKFKGNNRKVFLKGEAYFEVESDITKPFIVQTPNIQVKATGTKFRVQEFASNPVTEVTLVSGEVFVSEPGNDKGVKVIAKLSPNQNPI